MMIHGEHVTAGINDMLIEGDNLKGRIDFKGDTIRLSDHVEGTIKISLDVIPELLAMVEVALRFRHLDITPESDDDDEMDDEL